jgi:hypothetical protein
VAGRLRDPVGREREGEPAHDGGADRQPEGAQPERRESARTDVGQQEEGVPARDRPEQRLQRPEHEAERPAGEVDARLELRLEAVGIEPRRLPASQLVTRQPERIDGLQVVSRRHPSLAGHAVAEEAIGLEHGRRGREDPSAEVERGG